ncbi:hypothetical protein CKM354_000610300 [Cercospora kikuchii]|uniref:Uncharacterized protein n=1 Tax=Cercospora kikuchii TaxID=84275 RepID=A0A9P3CND5_9PEZI|nr:uncharacterized protein CKM354_000610300 [Cercospora kikuchii]GIZ42850.1 hypothetical protein CKM354_000610300 [Cercospora kikuchii]
MWFPAFLLSAIPLVHGSSARLPSFPLAVKTPYLSAWLPRNQAHHVPNAQPEFWKGQPLTWKILARVNNATVALFGCPDDDIAKANQSAISYTATHTLITLQAPESAIQFHLDFFSPVSTTDFARQSIPYSYLTVSVEGATDKDEIHVLTAIDETWSAQPGRMVMEWLEGHHSQSFIIKNYHQSHASEDDDDMATWGRMVLSSNMSAHTSYQSAPPNEILTQFSAHGRLSFQTDGYAEGHLIAFAHHFVDSASSSVTFAIGLQQDLNGFFGEEYETLYFEPMWPETEDVVDHFFADEADARRESAELDRRVREIGERCSPEYADLLESTIRQIWGTIHISIPWGKKETSYHIGFMKALSAGGHVSTVPDLLISTLPALYVLAPDYIPLLLAPVLNMTMQWQEDYAVRDIGKHFPNATGPTVHDKDASPVQQTSALLTMVYATKKLSEKANWTKVFLPTLQKCADYLVQHGQYPLAEPSVFDNSESRANQTLLSISAVIGLKSFAALSGLSNYSDIADVYASTALQVGTDSDQTHFISHFGGDSSSWVSAWPLAYDRLLDLQAFPESVYSMQSRWYETVIQPHGLQYSDATNYTVAQLAMMVAAVSSEKVRGSIVKSLHHTLMSNIASVPGPNSWPISGPDAGKKSLTQAQAAVGGYWMLAAVNMSTEKDMFINIHRQAFLGGGVVQVPM